VPRDRGLAGEDFVSIDDSSAVMSHGPALLMDCIASIVAIAAGAKSSKTATDAGTWQDATEEGQLLDLCGDGE
jgi:hypothetical protein